MFSSIFKKKDNKPDYNRIPSNGLKGIKQDKIIDQEFTIKPDEPNKLYLSDGENKYKYIIFTENPEELKEKIKNDTDLNYDQVKRRNKTYNQVNLGEKLGAFTVSYICKNSNGLFIGENYNKHYYLFYYNQNEGYQFHYELIGEEVRKDINKEIEMFAIINSGKDNIINQKFTIKPDEPNKLYLSDYSEKYNKKEIIIFTKNPEELKEKLQNDKDLVYKRIKFAKTTYNQIVLDTCNIRYSYKDTNDFKREEYLSSLSIDNTNILYLSSRSEIYKKYKNLMVDDYYKLIVNEIKNTYEKNKNVKEIIKIKIDYKIVYPDPKSIKEEPKTFKPEYIINPEFPNILGIYHKKTLIYDTNKEYIIYTKNPDELKEKLENDKDLVYKKEINGNNTYLRLYLNKVRVEIYYKDNDGYTIFEIASVDELFTDNQIYEKYKELMIDNYEEYYLDNIKCNISKSNEVKEIIKIVVNGKIIYSKE